MGVSTQRQFAGVGTVGYEEVNTVTPGASTRGLVPGAVTRGGSRLHSVFHVVLQVGGGLHHSASPEATHHQYPAAGRQSAASWLASQTELPGGAKHLQYNSPIGLYSKSSAQEAVYGGAADSQAAT